jgi:uncharacterized delta-60 repeat protein
MPNPDFNGGFITMAHVGGQDSRNYILAFAPIPGKGVLVLGRTHQAARMYYVSKFKLDGQLDSDFGDNGTISVGDTLDRPDLLLVGDRFLLTGFTNRTLYASCFSHADGKLDEGYGVNGTATVTLAELNPADALQGIRNKSISSIDADSLAQGEAKIPGVTPANNAATCYASDTGAVYFCFTADIKLPTVVRLNHSGKIDTTFNGAGFHILDLAGTAHSAATFSSAAVDQKQGLVVALRGSVEPPLRSQTRMHRLNEDGSQDFEFGNYFPAPVGDFGAAPKVVIDPIGTLKLINLTFGILARGYTAQGAPDLGFHGGGLLTTSIPEGGRGRGAGGASGSNTAYRLVAATHVGRFKLQAAVVRYLADGALDTEFGTGGIVTLDLDQVGQPMGVDLQVLPDSDILISTGYHLYWLAGFAR